MRPERRTRSLPIQLTNPQSTFCFFCIWFKTHGSKAGFCTLAEANIHLKDWATRFPGQLPHYLLMIGSGIHMSTMKNSV